MVNIGANIKGVIAICSVLAWAGVAAMAQTVDAAPPIDELEAPAISQIPAVFKIMPAVADEAGASDQVTLRNDPFSLDGLTEVLPEGVPLLSGFRPAATRPALPAMVLRGIGRMNGDDMPTALLDIKGHGLFIVTENETISLQGVSNDNVLRIVEINDVSVTVEAGSFGELIVVR